MRSFLVIAFKSELKSALVFVSLVLLFSCNEKSSHSEVKAENRREQRESAIDLNRQVLAIEDQQINQYVTRYNWPVKCTGSGLRVYVYKKGNGKQIKNKARVEAAYDLRLLDGRKIENSAIDGNMQITMDKTTIETGLYEAFLMLRVGDKAKIILPSHLAFGVTGDGSRIPPRAVLVYDIEILKVN